MRPDDFSSAWDARDQLIEQLRREIESTAVQQDLRGQMLALHQRIAELEHGLQVAQRERDALRLQIAELPRHE